MESPHSHDTDATSDERTSPNGIVLEGAAVRDMVRSIVRHPAVKEATVEMVRTGLTEPAEAQMREGVREGANEALARLSAGLRDGVKDALDALSDDDWTAIAREMLEEAQEANEAAAVA